VSDADETILSLLLIASGSIFSYHAGTSYGESPEAAQVFIILTTIAALLTHALTTDD